MIRIAYLGLLAVIPAQAYPQTETGNAGASLQGWSVAQLCDSREREEVRDELERRDLFSSRELRAIRDGEMKSGISLDALICGRGQPANIVDAVARTRFGPVAAYIYLPGETKGAVAYVVESSAESTVVHFIESDDPQAIVRNPDLILRCSQLTRCYLADNSANPYSAGARTFGSSTVIMLPSERCGERLCDADVSNQPTEPPLPPVPDDAR